MKIVNDLLALLTINIPSAADCPPPTGNFLAVRLLSYLFARLSEKFVRVVVVMG
ncbi:MAG: hypothetical protein WA705_06470 [Candidatus Ozemobacteraceae bacterium]